MKLQKTSDWIRTHIEFVTGMASVLSKADIDKHVEERLSNAFNLIRARVGMGLIRYESNRGRSPCYFEWLQASIKRYEETKNTDALLDVAFYAIAEFENPSREGTFYDPIREVRSER
jgi:hypothetical protein